MLIVVETLRIWRSFSLGILSSLLSWGFSRLSIFVCFLYRSPSIASRLFLVFFHDLFLSFLLTSAWFVLSFGLSLFLSRVDVWPPVAHQRVSHWSTRTPKPTPKTSRPKQAHLVRKALAASNAAMWVSLSWRRGFQPMQLFAYRL